MSVPARQQVSAGRRAMLAKVHMGANELGLREEERRDVLERLTGHRSSAACTDEQLDLVLKHFKSLGWAPKGQTAPAPAMKRTPAKSPVAMKARAMWISLWQLGVVRDRSEKALETFGARQLGVDRLQWADQSQGFRLIEALKKMAERDGWSQDLAMVKPDRQVWSLKARLANAQARKLGRGNLMTNGLTERELDALITSQAGEIHASEAQK